MRRPHVVAAARRPSGTVARAHDRGAARPRGELRRARRTRPRPAGPGRPVRRRPLETVVTTDPTVTPCMPQDSPALVAVTDQSVGRILVFDFDVEESRVSGCPPGTVWSWQPGDTNGYQSAVTNWGRPSDVRLRRDNGGELRMLVADSYGLVAVVGPNGRMLWSADTGPDANPHAAELLPDGAVAVAASAGGWVRLYPGLCGPHNDQFTQFDLADAHGVLWDPGTNVLWALGSSQLCRLQPARTGTTPRLLQSTADPLPSSGGHDLQPVYGNCDLLWVT